CPPPRRTRPGSTTTDSEGWFSWNEYDPSPGSMQSRCVEKNPERRAPPPGRGSRQPEILQHAHRGVRLVQRIEMQTGRACAQQFLALFRGVFDAELGRRRVVRVEFVQPRS